MKRFIAISLIIVTVMLSLSGCDVEDNFNQLVSAIRELSDTKEEVITEEYGMFSPEFDSCYNSLNANQKEIYKKIYSLCESMPVGYVKICKDYDKVVRDIAIAYKAVLNDHTDIFWMPDSYIVSRKSDNGYEREVHIAFEYKNSNGKSAKYPVNRKERNQMRNKLKKIVDSVVSEALKLEGQFEREKYFNDYICENTSYALGETFINTAYGCLVNKKALCEGYSRAFKLLCNKAGMECDLIVGEAEGEGHMWNSVNIDGMHSYVDVTWNDKPDYPYLYFNITDEQLSHDHALYPLYTEASDKKIKLGNSFNFVKRECSYLGNGYYQRNGYVLGDDFESKYAEKAAKLITANHKNGVNHTDFWLKSDKIQKEFSSDEEGFIKKIQRKLNSIQINSYGFKRDILVLYYEL